MKATLSLEYIGESQDARLAMLTGMCEQAIPGIGKTLVGDPRSRKPWIAEIVGVGGQYCLKRRFLKPNWQRKRSNGSGSRGVELWFVLESGRLYEVKSPVSWRSTDRYFCSVTEDGEVQRVEDAEAWLSARSE